MFTRIGAAAYKKDLHNTLALLQALDNPHRRFKSIHIAGTNGKGSTSHMLAAILHQAGYKTGLYTSPHLYDFRERVKVSGKERLEMIPEDFVIDFTERIRPLIEEIEPSFFEVTVALAFDWFADQKVEVAVIETGLGGRLDSTNVIVPELSIITNIGWDHMNLLGNTLELIAGEKAGIIKPAIPVVIGETLPETLPVFLQQAKACGSPILLAEHAFEIIHARTSIRQLQVTFCKPENPEPLEISCDLPGIYQQYNLRTTLTAIEQLQQQGWNIPENALQQALLQVKYLTGLGGRWQIIGEKPYVVLDVAHNVAGMTQLLKQIEELNRQLHFTMVHVVIGMVKDKEVEQMLEQLPTHFAYYFTQAQLPRALPYAELQEKALRLGLKGAGFPTPDEALLNARQNASENDLIVVCGSVFVVSEISI